MIDHTSNPSPEETETGKSLWLASGLSKNNRKAPGQYKTRSQNKREHWERVPRLSPGLHMHNPPPASVTHPQARTHSPHTHSHSRTYWSFWISCLILHWRLKKGLFILDGAKSRNNTGVIRSEYLWEQEYTMSGLLLNFWLLGVTVQLVSLGSNHLAS